MGLWRPPPTQVTPQAHHSPTLNNDRHFKCVPMLTFNRNQIKFYCNNIFWNARSRTRRKINDRTDDATGVLILAVYGGSDFFFFFCFARTARLLLTSAPSVRSSDVTAPILHWLAGKLSVIRAAPLGLWAAVMRPSDDAGGFLGNFYHWLDGARATSA